MSICLITEGPSLDKGNKNLPLEKVMTLLHINTLNYFHSRILCVQFGRNKSVFLVNWIFGKFLLAIYMYLTSYDGIRLVCGHNYVSYPHRISRVLTKLSCMQGERSMPPCSIPLYIYIFCLFVSSNDALCQDKLKLNQRLL